MNNINISQNNGVYVIMSNCMVGKMAVSCYAFCMGVETDKVRGLELDSFVNVVPP